MKVHNNNSHSLTLDSVFKAIACMIHGNEKGPSMTGIVNILTKLNAILPTAAKHGFIFVSTIVLHTVLRYNHIHTRVRGTFRLARNYQDMKAQRWLSQTLMKNSLCFLQLFCIFNCVILARSSLSWVVPIKTKQKSHQRSQVAVP